MKRLLLASFLLCACARNTGIPKAAVAHCDNEAAALVEDYARTVSVTDEVKHCMFDRMRLDCQEEMVKHAYQKKQPPQTWFYRFAGGGMWDRDDFVDDVDERERAFEACGSATAKAKALKHVGLLTAAAGGVIDWANRGWARPLPPGACKSCPTQ